MNIEVYSVKSFAGSTLKSKLEIALAQQNLPYTVSEINNVDEFIKAGLTSVPAVKVGSRVIELHDESFDSTVQKALDLIMGEREKYILVPVDFSPESIHALRYARMLASHLDMAITVVHVHQPLFDPITGSAFDIEMMQKNRERLDEMVIGIEWDQYRVGETHVPIHTHFETGDVSSHLIHLAGDEKYAMVIMSTRAEDSFMKRMLGSISTQVGKLGSKPVIVVPPNTPIKYPGKLVVGLTENLLKGKALDELLNFATDQQLIVDFINATNDQEAFRKLKNNLYERLVQRKDQLTGFNIRSVDYVEGKVHETLSDYAQRAHAGLLVLVTKHRNLIESLTHQSVSKKALLHPSLPLMLMHTQR